MTGRSSRQGPTLERRPARGEATDARLHSPLRLFSCLVMSGCWLAAPSANAEPTPLPEPRDLVRPHGAAEFGFGLLTLPGAEVCVDVSQGCETGDTSLELHAWQLFRVSQELALGAGLTMALTPSTDAPRRDPPGITRDHARRYLTIEATGRYYALVQRSFESWLGATSGLVVLSDRFTPQNTEDDRALIGAPGVTIRTEGLTVGLAGGVDVALAPNWSLGTSLRMALWFLPSESARSPLGDEASLSGRVLMFDLGLSVAYRLNL